MTEFQPAEADARSEGVEVITVSDDEELPQPMEWDEPIKSRLEEFKTLIQPVPKDKDNMFNRAEYKVSPKLKEITEESNRVVTKFLDASLPHVRRKDVKCILDRLHLLVSQTNLHYLASKGFQRTLTEMTNKVSKVSNRSAAYLHLKGLADELRAHRERRPKEKDETLYVALKPEEEHQSTSDERSLVSLAAPPQAPNAAPGALGEQPGTSGNSTQVVKENITRHRLLKKGLLQEKNGPSPRVCKNIDKLGDYLVWLIKHIKKLHQAEFDPDEDDDASPYIKEDKLMKRAWEVWLKMCQLEGRRPDTGRLRDRKFKFTGTPYRAINAQVERLVNKKIFPDYSDICNMVKRKNEQDDLGLSVREAESLAEEVFAKVGQALQRRRKTDELSEAIAYLGDHGDYDTDPADSDRTLMAKLEENRKLFQKKMDDVIQSYVDKEKELHLEPVVVIDEDCDRSLDLENNNSSEEEEDESDDTEDDLRSDQKDLLQNGSCNNGEQDAEEKVGEVYKPPREADLQASLASKQSLKRPLAGDGLGRAIGGYNSAGQLSIKPISGGTSISGSSGVSGKAKHSIGPVHDGNPVITLVPGTSRPTELTVAPLTNAKGEAELPYSSAAVGERKYGIKNGSIVMPELTIIPIGTKLSPGPTGGSNGQKLPVKRQRSSSGEEHERDVIRILSDDEVSSP